MSWRLSPHGHPRRDEQVIVVHVYGDALGARFRTAHDRRVRRGHAIDRYTSLPSAEPGDHRSVAILRRRFGPAVEIIHVVISHFRRARLSRIEAEDRSRSA